MIEYFTAIPVTIVPIDVIPIPACLLISFSVYFLCKSINLIIFMRILFPNRGCYVKWYRDLCGKRLRFFNGVVAVALAKNKKIKIYALFNKIKEACDKIKEKWQGACDKVKEKWQGVKENSPVFTKPREIRRKIKDKYKEVEGYSTVIIGIKKIYAKAIDKSEECGMYFRYYRHKYLIRPVMLTYYWLRINIFNLESLLDFFVIFVMYVQVPYTLYILGKDVWIKWKEYKDWKKKNKK
jgi:hypothetical protein